MKLRALRLINPLLVAVSLFAMIGAAIVPNLSPFPDPTGAVGTFSSSGKSIHQARSFKAWERMAAPAAHAIA